MPRQSKIQLMIIGLYRQFLRVAKDKPGVREFVQHEFRKNASIPKKNSIQIEYLIRRGQKQLDTLKSSQVRGVGVFENNDKKK